MTLISTNDNPESKTPSAYFSSVYFFSVAVLYLWGYWSQFNVNVLEYISLTDVVKTAAYPIASVFIFMAIGMIAGEFVFPKGFLPEGGGADTRIGRTLRRAAPAILVVYAGVTTLLWLLGPTEKWQILPVFVSLPLSLALKEAGFLKTFIGSERLRSIALFAMAALPPFAYGQGVLRAHDIISGKSYSYILSPIDGHPYEKTSKPESRLRYVGKAGEEYFLYSPESQSMLILPTKDAKLIEIKAKSSHAPKPGESPASAVSTPPENLAPPAKPSASGSASSQSSSPRS
jgi:hypothetical protein